MQPAIHKAMTGTTARFNRDYLKNFVKDRELLEINPTTPALS